VSLRLKLAAALGAAILIVLVGATAVYAWYEAQTAAGWVDHTVRVRMQLQQALRTTVDAETGERGFLLTGDSAYLAPYLRTRTEVDHELASLRALTADNPVEQRGIDSLSLVTDERLVIIESVVRLASSGRRDSALAIIRSGAGLAAQTHIRQILGEMDAIEQRLLAERTAAYRRRVLAEVLIVIFGTLAAAALAILTLASIRTSIIDLERANAEMAASRAVQARYADQLRVLADAAVAVNSATDVRDMLRAAAVHACRITGSAAAAIPLAREIAEELGLRTADIPAFRADSSETTLTTDSPVRVPLPSRDGGALGDIAIAPWDPQPGDMVVLAQLARLVAGALENVRLYRDAQRATSARDDVLAVVSHDLRNPLHTIGLSASFLEELIPADAPATTREQTRIIQRAVRRATRLIQDLLDITRIEAGALSVAAHVARPELLVGDALDAMQPTATEAGIRLEYQKDGTLPAVCADRERILQVFTNLIGNAIRFTPRDGAITLSATRAGETHVRFSVRDTGSGIAPDQLPHVFDRFWQARHGSRTGAGLGLAIVKGIVEAHGGTVDVSSVPGEGTELTFTLPVAD
jgi:signal transduction histidine kinase